MVGTKRAAVNVSPYMRKYFYNLSQTYIQSEGINHKALASLRQAKREGLADVDSYRTWIEVLTIAKDKNEIAKVLPELHRLGFEVDAFTYGTILTSLGHLGDFRSCESVLRDMLEWKVPVTSTVYNRLLSMWNENNDDYKRCWDIVKKLPVAADAPTTSTDPQSTTDTTSATTTSQTPTPHLLECKRLLREMRSKNITPTTKTYNAIMSNASSFTVAQSIYDDMVVNGIAPDMYTFNTMLEKAGEKEASTKSLEILAMMKTFNLHPDVVTYNLLIKSRAKARDMKRCLAFKTMMESKGIKPSIVTYTELLKFARESRDKRFYDQMVKDFQASGISPNIAIEQLLNLPEDTNYWFHK